MHSTWYRPPGEGEPNSSRLLVELQAAHETLPEPPTLGCEESRTDPALDAIDAVEYGRGQLAALSYRSANEAGDVHVLSLRNAFERARITHKFRYAFGVIGLMREAQELRGGYWFPTPLRIVTIGEQVIVVGSVPTCELRRHFRSISRAGFARVLPEAEGQQLPRQPLDEWLELDATDAVSWAHSQLVSARAALSPTVSPMTVEFFDVRPRRSRFGWVMHPRWACSIKGQVREWQGMVLCRERRGRDLFRYFLGTVESDRLVAEAFSPPDATRMMFAFAALAGTPITVEICADARSSVFEIPSSLPRAERQLILALGVREPSPTGKAYRVRGEVLVSLIAGKLQSLGCELRSRNV